MEMIKLFLSLDAQGINVFLTAEGMTKLDQLVSSEAAVSLSDLEGGASEYAAG